MSPAARILQAVTEAQDALVAFVRDLATIETPSRAPDTQPPALEAYAEALRALDFEVAVHPGQGGSGGMLHAVMPDRQGPRQLLIGHIDTVWPVGMLAEMPLEQQDGTLAGPGVYDMKSGLAMIVFALRTLRTLGLVPEVIPEVLVNSDEEIGSRESTALIAERAEGADRAYVLEPSAGPDGMIKTARKGIARFTVTVHGRASHAGLAPEAGASAILELSHQIQALFALNDPARGVTVNVGMVEGGMGANVVAPRSEAVVDVRVPSQEEAERVEAAIRALTPATEGVTLEITGGFGRPPMEPDDAARALWAHARHAGEALGLDLDEAHVGGASDGNTTSQFCPTLDGLGPVGDGAHARHEHVRISTMVVRTALLALLILAPPVASLEAP